MRFNIAKILAFGIFLVSSPVSGSAQPNGGQMREPWISSEDNPFFDRHGGQYTNEMEGNVPKIVFLSAIHFYQKFLSAANGKVCLMYPSCSHYGYLSIKKHGIVLGCLMTADRLMRCNPDAKNHCLRIFMEGDDYFFDPVENNDFWHHRGEKK